MYNLYWTGIPGLTILSINLLLYFQKFFATAGDYDKLSPQQKETFPHAEYDDMCRENGGEPHLAYVDVR